MNSNAILLGYKPYEFTTDKGDIVKGYNLFFSLDSIGIEGKGCTVVKTMLDSSTGKYTYDFIPNQLSVGAPYILEYGVALDKDLKPISKLLKVTRAK